MEPSFVQSAKIAVVAAIGLSRDALHVHIGLAVFFAMAVVSRKSLAPLVPWRRQTSLHDLVSTVFWPSVLMVVFRFGRNPFGLRR